MVDLLEIPGSVEGLQGVAHNWALQLTDLRRHAPGWGYTGDSPVGSSWARVAPPRPQLNAGRYTHMSRLMGSGRYKGSSAFFPLLG